MNEQLLASAWQQICDTITAIRRSGEWEETCASFDMYAAKRWALSKTRTTLFLRFAKFCELCREHKFPLPDCPDNVAPLLGIQQYRWLDTWGMCVAHGATTASQIRALFSHMGIVTNKRMPEHVLKGQRVRKAAKTLADLGDGEAVVDEIGPNGLGRNWNDAVRVVIDADQRRMSELGKP